MVLSWNTKMVCDKIAGDKEDEGKLINPDQVERCIYTAPNAGKIFNLNPLNRVSGMNSLKLIV